MLWGVGGIIYWQKVLIISFNGKEVSLKLKFSGLLFRYSQPA